jgi:hypothetical protein
MKAARLLDIDTLVFVEPSFADLTHDTFTDLLLEPEATAAKMLVDENDDLLAIALCTGEQWRATTFLFRPPTIDAIERLDAVPTECYQEDREVWSAAVREYYAREIQQFVTPALEDLPPYRGELIRDLIGETLGKGAGRRCLDCCCGSGVGSAELRSFSWEPLAFDNDPSLLSLGLGAGRLSPDATCCIDATVASTYIPPATHGAGFMLGAIDAYNTDIWKAIVGELVGLTEETLITVGSKNERHLVAGWCRDLQAEVEEYENDRDPIYDRHVCIVRRHTGSPAE